MNKDLHDFQQFMKHREDVGRAYVNGNAEPLSHIVTHVSPATFLGPQGGHQEGAQKVATKYEHDAMAFNTGGDSSFEVLAMEASEAFGYWTGIQRAKAHMKGQADAVSMSLRITEVFRREDGEWKMVHRHADPLVSEAAKGKESKGGSKAHAAK
jgi:ketosteroid isomerase-like protein